MMLRRTWIWMTAASLLLAGRLPADNAATNRPADFQEVYGLLRAHLPGITEADLNQAAVAGLLSQFPGRATIVGDGTAASTNHPEYQTVILDHGVLYFRVSRLTDSLPATLADQLRTTSLSAAATNPPVGTILDLRFATGDAYGIVKDAASRLAPAKSPLIVLINGATLGAPELLAAALRDAGALLVGNPSAGQAMTTEDFPLADGRRLRLATTPILWHGAVLAQLQPDIVIPMDLEAERAFQANPYGPAGMGSDPSGSGAHNASALLDHTSEADLVRQKRQDGDGDENPEPPVKVEPARPVLRDPVLARAVDLVEGLAVVRPSHP